jgi:lycopene cyclase domain-containing protein
MITLSLTYLEFLAVFLLVPLAVLGLGAVLGDNPHRPSLRVQLLGSAFMVVLALAYTTPWDNYLISQEVWWYGDGRVLATVWLAPLEEYLFIVLQSVLVAVWTFQLAGPVAHVPAHTWRDRILGALAGLAVAAVGIGLLAGPQTTFYLGAILAWAGPVLALQWAVGWRYLLEVPRRVGLAIAVPVLYLGVVDRIAIADGIWVISPEHTTGLAIAGLPVEEALFFLLTSTFLVQALVLLRWVIDRWA